MKWKEFYLLIFLTKVSFSSGNGNNVTRGLDILMLSPKVNVLRSVAFDRAFDQILIAVKRTRVLHRGGIQVGFFLSNNEIWSIQDTA